MKRIIITLVAVLAFAFGAGAQNWYAGGSASVDLWGKHRGANQDGGEFGLSFNPEVGYIINDKFSVGAYVSLGFEAEWMNGGESEPLEFVCSFNPYFRWTFLRIGEKFNLLADAVVSLGCEDSQFSYGVGIMPGFAYAFNDKLSLVTHLANLGFKGKGNGMDYGFSVISGPSVGIYWAF